MNEASMKPTNKWTDNQRYCGSSTSKGRNSKLLDGTFHVSPVATSMQTVGDIQEQVSTARDAIGEQLYTVPSQNHLHGHDARVGFFLHSSLQRHGEPRNATVIGDCAGRSRPGSWIFAGPGSEHMWHLNKWDKPENPEGNGDGKELQMMEVHSKRGHPVISCTTIFEKGSLRQAGRKDQHSHPLQRAVCQNDLQADRIIESILHALRCCKVPARTDSRRRNARQLGKCQGSLDASQRAERTCS